MTNTPPPTGVTISGHIGTVSGDIIGGNQINNYGPTQAQLIAAMMQALDARGATAQAEAAGLPRDAVLALAQRLKPGETLDLAQATAELHHAVDIAIEITTRPNHPDAALAPILTKLADQTRAGDLDTGADTLDQALADLDQQRRTLLERAVQVETLRRDAPAAAARIEALIALDHPDRPTWDPAYRARYETLLAEGDALGLAFSLELALALADRMLATAQDDDERGQSLTDRCNALWQLSRLDPGTTHLEQAIQAARATLLIWTRDRAPLGWAAAQNNLGVTLNDLFDRRSDATLLDQAVAAFQAALLERTRARAATDWAMTQHNLGTALLRLGQRDVATTHLDQAVTAFQAALQVRTRDRAPLEWAMTQDALGTALQTLGEREPGTARLQQAVEAYQAALLERTRDRTPLQWAASHNNLANALQALGERERGTTRLEQAAESYQAALQEWTRERAPLLWATAQNNLGNVLETLGRRQGSTERLQQAVAAFQAALQERTRERVPREWADTQNNLGIALEELAQREPSQERRAETLRQALDAYQSALEIRTRDRAPLDWAVTQNNRANALRALGQPADLRRAIDAYQAALEEITQDRMPLQWATIQNNLGDTLHSLAATEPGADRLAAAAYEACLTVAETVWPAKWVDGVRSKRDAARNS